jgi:hypothetical protein
MSGHDPFDRLARRAATAVEDAAHPRVGGAPDPDELRAVHGRRRNRQRVAAGVAAVATVAVLVGVGMDPLPDSLELWIDDVIGDPSNPDQDDAAPTEPSDLPLGLVTVGGDGIGLVPFDPPSEPTLLESDQFFEHVMWALPDQRGGLVFQHEVTPPPWPPGAVLWLRAGATRPEVLIPPATAWEASTFPRAGIMPIGTATTNDGRALFVYAVGDEHPAGGYDVLTDPTRIMVADLDGDGTLRQLAVLDGAMHEFGRYDAVTGGAFVAVIDRQVEECLTVTLLHVDDGSRIPTPSNCLPDGPWVRRALSHDGSSLAAVWWPDQGVEPELNMSVMDVSTGAAVEQATIPMQDELDGFSLYSRPTGWVVEVHTGSAVVLVDIDGNELKRVDRSKVPGEVGSAGLTGLYHHPFDLASGASLGSGSGQLPCQPFTEHLPVQGLPEPVAATRQVLFDLAATCDYQSLASLAREHATTVFVSGLGSGLAVGDDDVYLTSEDDLVRSWIADGRSGPEAYGILAREPLAALAELLSEPPAYIEHAADLPASQPQREGPVWVWPAQWVEAPPVFGTAHTDHRVGITPDGTWRFFMAGDFG